jgi:VWFA-related protein
VFGEAVAIRSGLTSDAEALRAAINTPFQGGQTSLVDAVQACLLLADSEPGRALVLMFSDGVEVSSFLTTDAPLQTAKRSNAIVYGVSPRGVKRGPFLRDLTEASGGDFIEFKSSEEIERTFKKVLDEFRHRYLLSYSPTGVEAGGWHQLKVRVKSRDVAVKARPGYAR